MAQPSECIMVLIEDASRVLPSVSEPLEVLCFGLLMGSWSEYCPRNVCGIFSGLGPEVVKCARVGGPLVLPFPEALAPKWLGSTGRLRGPHQSWAVGRTRRWGPGRVGRMLMRVREVVEVRDTSTGGSERKGARVPRGHASSCR